jgi:signal transduction histidine kinase
MSSSQLTRDDLPLRGYDATPRRDGDVDDVSLQRVDADRFAKRQAITAQLAAALSVDALSNALLAVAETFEGGAAAVYLLDRDGELRLKAARGTPSIDTPAPLTEALASGEPVLVGTRREFEQRYPASAATAVPTGMQATAALPLLHGTRVLGGFAVSFETPREFDENERRWLISIAADAAVAAHRVRLVDDLTHALRLNELFVGVLAHDLRGPLAAVEASAALMKLKMARDDALDPGKADSANRILGSSKRMARLIEQLLDFTRLRVGAGLALAPKTADLAPLVAQLAEEVETGRSDATVRVELVGDVRGSWDVDRLEQMLSNLIGNAVQHGIGGDVRVLVDGTDPQVVRVGVHNLGVIPGDLISKLFDPLTAGERRHDGQLGLGLGLYIAKEIVAAHRGEVTVESNLAAGTTFTVSLPRSLAGTALHGADSRSLPAEPINLPHAFDEVVEPLTGPHAALPSPPDLDVENFRARFEQLKLELQQRSLELAGLCLETAELHNKFNRRWLASAASFESDRTERRWEELFQAVSDRPVTHLGQQSSKLVPLTADE